METDVLSEYERRARLTPGLLGAAPVSVTVAALEFRHMPVVAAALAALTLAGGTYVLAVIVAHLGRGVQANLWREWGGPPSRRFLQLRSQLGNGRVEQAVVTPQRRLNWRRAVTIYTDVELPDEAAERADPQAADATIDTAIGACLHLGQGGAQGIQVVQAENAQYGLERNLLGFRWYGVGIAVLTIAATLVIMIATNRFDVGSWHVSAAEAVVAIVVNCLFLLLWIVLPSKRRARAAAERYAVQLLDAVVSATRSSQ